MSSCPSIQNTQTEALSFPIEDVQGSPDGRNIPIDWVGIRNLRYPIRFGDLTQDHASTQPSVGVFNMHVALPAHQKGTHMSRFVEILENLRVENRLLTLHALEDMAMEMLQKLDTHAAKIEMKFTYFREKSAPISGVKSLMDYEVTLFTECHLHQGCKTTIEIIVPVTSLCPCSKTISDYGAHNQRSHLTLQVQIDGEFAIETLIQIAEDEASASLYGLLKRPDEKFVTEQAYNNPKFVEDMVRDLAKRLSDTPQITHYIVESENFESIHNHSAHAVIKK